MSSNDLPGYEAAQKAAARYAPWRKGVSWIVILLQGIILGIIGLLILVNPTSAAGTVILLVSIYIAFTGLIQVFAIIRGGEESAGRGRQLALVRAGASLTVGLIGVVLSLLPGVEPSAVAVIVGLGLIIIGALSLIAVLFIRGGSPFSIGALITAIVFIVFGIVMLMMSSGSLAFSTMGWIALIAGIVLIVLGIIRYGQSSRPAAA
jgi:uncharacterized membrane protein HdeD (DUF308 family)